MTASTARVLIITDEPIGPFTSEASMRAWEFARVLAREFPTTLAAPGYAPPDAPGFACVGLPPTGESIAALIDLIAAHEIIIARTLPLAEIPAEMIATKHLIIDLAHVWVIEGLQVHQGAEGIDEGWLARDLTAMSDLLAAGDFFICVGEAQRAFWLGALAQAGRLTETVYGRADDGRALIDVVPFGVPSVPPLKRAKALKGIVPGIGANDFVALWNAEPRPWLDPFALIHAVARLRDVDYPIRAYFLNDHPDNAVVRRRSDELNLTGTHVFFHEGRLGRGERIEFLLEADAVISLHLRTLEARFAFRTPALDALWAGIVPVVSDGDATAELLRGYDAGRVVPPGDDAALALTLANLIDNPYERRLLAGRGHTIGQSFAWETVTAPLLAFCHQPVKGTRVPGFVTADLRERVNELERTLYATSTYAERLERELAERGGPNLAAPADRGMGARLRRAMGGIRQAPNRASTGDEPSNNSPDEPTPV